MNILLIYILLLLTITTSNALPIFAKKYNISCVSCHTKPPALNKTGKLFMRNGFKLSKSEETSFSLLKKKSFADKKIPLDVLFVGIHDKDNNKDHLMRKVKMHLGGSITDSLSFLGFISTGWFKNTSEIDDRVFDDKTSMYYFQYQAEDSNSVFRVGSMFPLAQFGEIRRAQRFAPFIGRYKKPSNFVNLKKIKGIEYSHYLNDILFLANYGHTVGKEKEEVNLGVNYSYNSIVNFGILYNKYISQESFLFPVEIDINNITINSTLFYNKTKDFRGLENTLIYQLKSMQQIRVMLNTDNKENNAFTLEYNKIFSPTNGITFQYTISASRIEKLKNNKINNDDLYQLSAILAF